jgi:thiopeptide-type bacteriocin biosynthesis protein
VVDGWHFVRYSDPDYHLRLRLHGDGATLHEEVLPRLERAVAEEMRNGRLWRFVLDTYVREVERYGGGAALDAVEGIFAADSVAVIELISMVPAVEERLDVALLGADSLLDEQGLALPEKREIASSLVAGLRRRLPAGTLPRYELDAELRQKRVELEDARRNLRQGRPPDVAAALQKRAAAIAPLAERLAAAEAAGALTAPVSEIAKSLAHMHVNRMLRDPLDEDELRVFYWLGRLYQSEAARAG